LLSRLGTLCIFTLNEIKNGRQKNLNLKSNNCHLTQTHSDLDPSALEELEEISEEENCSKDVGNAQQLRGHSRGII
jgi:hypothetical protein